MREFLSRKTLYTIRSTLLAFSVMGLAYSAQFPIEVPFDPVQRLMKRTFTNFKFHIPNSKFYVTDSVIRNDFLLNDDIIGGSSQDGVEI
ncbi:MAG: hypothetical protein OEZ20_09910, partial [candidate division WOR-3 bacterium]|nr:hypothetical protein [candidate division WOR-3 bacterium]